MVLEEAGLKGITKPFGEVEKTMNEAGFIRGGAWDYSKASFDLKLSTAENDYYLRIRAHVVQGRLEKPQAVVKLENPVFYRHIFPHGLEEDSIPEELQGRVDQALTYLNEHLS
ncbi:hypothetical protein GCM10007416_24000 [Kroppenstedtia guangzhouensis]|uniref:YugN-like family protein n=1 Tax=Kroppenstedtia guangzhouensis TaxID=1274356 RepID=A0ABQ1GV04_9BACL|nr:YugN family protein [Kroppenstedtia guangzhouensis]GGA50047.1 hypothetical protein GCM10007416_24000 [Kroppenstedtia guangzhouensis]